MKWIGILATVATATAPLACAPSAPPPSPFSAGGRLDVPGIIAVVHVKAPLEVQDSNVAVLVLDRERYGASVAAVLSGGAREELFAKLVESAFLAPDRNQSDAFAVKLPAISEAMTGLDDRGAAAMGAIPSRIAGSIVRRYDGGDSIALLPTVDLRELALGLADSIAADPIAGDDAIAVAIDGREVARFIAREIQPIVRSASAMRAAFGSEHPNTSAAVLGLELLRRSMQDVDRWTFRVRPAGATGLEFDASIEAREGAPPVGLIAALAPISGDWPETPVRIALQSHPMADALDQTGAAYSSGPDGDEVRESLAALARTLRETGIDRLSVDAVHLGPGVDPAAAKRAINALAESLGIRRSDEGPEPVFADGWLFLRGAARPIGAVPSDPEAVASVSVGSDSIVVRRTSRGLSIRGRLPAR